MKVLIVRRSSASAEKVEECVGRFVALGVAEGDIVRLDAALEGDGVVAAGVGHGDDLPRTLLPAPFNQPEVFARIIAHAREDGARVVLLASEDECVAGSAVVFHARAFAGQVWISTSTAVVQVKNRQGALAPDIALKSQPEVAS